MPVLQLALTDNSPIPFGFFRNVLDLSNYWKYFYHPTVEAEFATFNGTSTVLFQAHVILIDTTVYFVSFTQTFSRQTNKEALEKSVIFLVCC